MTDMRWGVCYQGQDGVRVVAEYDDEQGARDYLPYYAPGSFVVRASFRPPVWERADPCPIHGPGCDADPAGCVTVHQAECAAHGLPLLDTGGQA